LVRDALAASGPGSGGWHRRRGLAHQRLYVVTGPGGCGKTALGEALAGHTRRALRTIPCSHTTDNTNSGGDDAAADGAADGTADVDDDAGAAASFGARLTDAQLLRLLVACPPSALVVLELPSSPGTLRFPGRRGKQQQHLTAEGVVAALAAAPPDTVRDFALLSVAWMLVVRVSVGSSGGADLAAFPFQ